MRLKDTGLTSQDIKDKVNKYMIETYERFDFLAERAKDMYMYDENGEEYLDLNGNISNKDLEFGEFVVSLTDFVNLNTRIKEAFQEYYQQQDMSYEDAMKEFYLDYTSKYKDAIQVELHSFYLKNSYEPRTMSVAGVSLSKSSYISPKMVEAYDTTGYSVRELMVHADNYSDLFDLTAIGLLLEYVVMWGPLALVIIFQPEIRSVLEQLGRSQLLGRHKVLTISERERIVYEIGLSLEYLKKHRIGALIVIERNTSLSEYIERSKKLYAEISNELLDAIFFPDNPLHDGGVIIQGDKVTCAGAVFPTTVEMKFSKRLGTRHRAAIGISEESDAIAIIVSEETGRISIAIGGELNYNLSVEEAKMLILDELKPKKTEFDYEINEDGDEDE